MLNEVDTKDGGRLIELFKAKHFGQLTLRILPPNKKTKGHRHPKTDEWWMIIKGAASVRLEYPDGYKVEKVYSGEDIKAFNVPAGTGHQLINMGNNDVYLLFWSNRIYKPKTHDKEGWSW